MAESSFVAVPDRGLAPLDQPISAQSGLLTDNFISSDSLPLDDPASASPISERRGPPLTIKAHLAQLERRHHALEASIDEALAHELSKDSEIMELKRQKLHLKDEIEWLQLQHS